MIPFFKIQRRVLFDSVSISMFFILLTLKQTVIVMLLMNNQVGHIHFLKLRMLAEIAVTGKLLCSLNLSHDFFSIY